MAALSIFKLQPDPQAYDNAFSKTTGYQTDPILEIVKWLMRHASFPLPNQA